jgi:hypothetical protein
MQQHTEHMLSHGQATTSAPAAALAGYTAANGSNGSHALRQQQQQQDTNGRQHHQQLQQQQSDGQQQVSGAGSGINTSSSSSSSSSRRAADRQLVRPLQGTGARGGEQLTFESTGSLCCVGLCCQHTHELCMALK